MRRSDAAQIDARPSVTLSGLQLAADVSVRRRTPVDVVEVLIPLDAAVLVRVSESRELLVRPGEAVYLSETPSGYVELGSRRSCRVVQVSLPRLDLEATAGCEASLRLMTGSALLGPTTRFLVELLRASSPAPAGLEPSLQRLVRQMLGAVLAEAESRETVPPSWLGVLDRAREQIAAHRTDPALTTRSLAASLCVSPRHLQRAFATAGTTPQREIRRQRAELAIELLQNPAFAVLSVDQLARQSSFHDAAELRRALTAHGHPTPRLLRTRPRAHAA